MRCINEKCEMRKHCEKAHTLNNLKMNEDMEVVVPNRFFFELNINNRLAKIGVPSEDFTFGCFKIIKGYDKDFDIETGSLYINDNHVIDFSLTDLIDMSNTAFREMIEMGEIEIR